MWREPETVGGEGVDRVDVLARRGAIKQRRSAHLPSARAQRARPSRFARSGTSV